MQSMIDHNSRWVIVRHSCLEIGPPPLIKVGLLARQYQELLSISWRAAQSKMYSTRKEREVQWNS